MTNNNNWAGLSQHEKAQLISIYTKHGYTKLSDIVKHYNSFDVGGNKNKYPSINTKEGKQMAKNIAQEVMNGYLNIKDVPREYYNYIQGEINGAQIVRDALNKSQVFSSERMLNRVPGDEFDVKDENGNIINGTKGTKGPIGAVLSYLFNNENYVNDRIKSSIGTDQETNLKVHEDAKRIYLGYQPKYGTIEKSQYKPTIGRTGETYQINSLLNDDEFENLIFPAFALWKGDGAYFKADQILAPSIYDDNQEPITIKVDRVQPIENKDNIAILKNALYLNDATISLGFDNKGQYISLYDIWDFYGRLGGIGQHPGDNVGHLVGGKPFEIYQRYYLDDWLDIPEESKGNPYIAPAIVSDFYNF